MIVCFLAIFIMNTKSTGRAVSSFRYTSNNCHGHSSSTNPMTRRSFSQRTMSSSINGESRTRPPPRSPPARLLLIDDSMARPLRATAPLPLVLDHDDDPRHQAARNFPAHFIFGAATSSYQIEGAVREGDRGATVWDTFTHRKPSPILDGSDGNVACDHYHRFKDDIELLKQLNLKAYRFSVCWTRILPTGTLDSINPTGVRFYNELIDTLLDNGIAPLVTLFHWDTPQTLEDRFGGWLDRRTADIFAADYARLAFELFGDRVKQWITINEPWSVSVLGYNDGVHAPGQKSIVKPYLVAHNFLLAHAMATHIYRTEFQTIQKGIIGLASNCDFRYPLVADDAACQEAAERAMLFHLGWFFDPIVFGDYPAVMREYLGDRLPFFSPGDRKMLMEAGTDFVGLHYYTASLVSPTSPSQLPLHSPNFIDEPEVGYWADMHVNFHDPPQWRKTDMGWNVVPDGLRELLLWISQRYGNPPIIITECGCAEDEPDLDASVNDHNRCLFYEDHLRACARAIHAGVDVTGFYAWSLMDNFEWNYGYQRRFGLFYVDFQTQQRIPKSSAHFYREIIRNHGENIIGIGYSELRDHDRRDDEIFFKI